MTHLMVPLTILPQARLTLICRSNEQISDSFYNLIFAAIFHFIYLPNLYRKSDAGYRRQKHRAHRRLCFSQI